MMKILDVQSPFLPFLFADVCAVICRKMLYGTCVAVPLPSRILKQSIVNYKKTERFFVGLFLLGTQR